MTCQCQCKKLDHAMDPVELNQMRVLIYKLCVCVYVVQDSCDSLSRLYFLSFLSFSSFFAFLPVRLNSDFGLNECMCLPERQKQRLKVQSIMNLTKGPHTNGYSLRLIL